jgi:sporulation protein YlmC with PRC-barrel domain
MHVSDDELTGRTVIAADGNAIGEVIGFGIESDTWSIETLRVRLRNAAADQVGASRSIFRSGTIAIPVAFVQSVGHAVVLNVPTAALREGAMAVGQQGAGANG